MKLSTNLAATVGAVAAAVAPAGPNTSLPGIAFWRTKSFWLLVLGLATPVLQRHGIDPLSILGVETAQDGAQTLAGFAGTVVPFLLAVGQRAAPNFRLSWR